MPRKARRQAADPLTRTSIIENDSGANGEITVNICKNRTGQNLINRENKV